MAAVPAERSFADSGSSEATARLICSRSFASARSARLIQRQPCEHTSKPEAGIDRGSGLMAFQGVRAGEPVIGSSRSWNRRISRQKPTRLPYSNVLSTARSRQLPFWLRPCASVAEFGLALSVLHRRLQALLLVHDKIERESRSVPPLGIGRVAAVADQVPVVAVTHRGLSLLLFCTAAMSAWPYLLRLERFLPSGDGLADARHVLAPYVGRSTGIASSECCHEFTVLTD